MSSPDLSPLSTRVTPLAMAAERVVPVLAALAPLFPDGGLTRGHCVACGGPVAMSTALGLTAMATRDGHWVAITGVDEVGARAAAEVGVALERVVLVAGAPAHDPAVLAALVDGFDVVMIGRANRVQPAVARRLQARAQARGVVTVVVGAPGGFRTDAVIDSGEVVWEGLEAGTGRLTRRRVTLQAGGRRIPRPRRCTVWLPGGNGGIEAGLAVPSEPVLDRVG